MVYTVCASAVILGGFLRLNSFENVAHVQAFYSYAILFVAD